MMMLCLWMMSLGMVQASEIVSSGSSMRTIEPGVSHAIDLLERTETGRSIMESARSKNLQIIEGKISKTEIIATRIVQGQNEKIEYTVQVVLSKEKNGVFQAIDLAHELIHALNPKTNPFDPRLNAVSYIREGIEGEGGEADAILQECRVGRELVTHVDEDAAQLIKARCHYVWKMEKDPTRWKLSFYHLGRHLEHFRNKLANLENDPDRIVKISRVIQSKDPMFTSAAANKPYPLALLDEYVEITQKICNRSSTHPRVEVVGELEERCQSLSSALFTPQ